ncbi:MAG: hypothetical protein EXS36_04865 [Pedosphaera sp.]|nr:hypothetical protein [Pedosphaera sp.]
MRGKPLMMLLALMLSWTFIESRSRAQGTIENGALATGTIATVGAIDNWNFPAKAGNTMIVRVGQTGADTAFSPSLRLLGPGGVQLASTFGAVAAEVVVRATNSGIFTIRVSDGSNGAKQTGSYRLTLALTGDPVVVSPGDEGGPLTSGVMHLGEISTGDMDVWTVNANTGDSIIVRAGEIKAGSLLNPGIRIFGPNGAQLDTSSGPASSEVEIRAVESGVFLVVVGDGNNGIVGTGGYRLTLAAIRGSIAVSPGDEGGPMIKGVTHGGEISTGDLDVWYFSACAGEVITLQLDKTGGGTLLPWMRLYGRDGAQINTLANATTVRITTRSIPASGTYVIVIGDGNNGIGGTGSYRLTGDGQYGLYAGMKVCPVKSGVTLGLDGAGGVAGSYLCRDSDLRPDLATGEMETDLHEHLLNICGNHRPQPSQFRHAPPVFPSHPEMIRVA